MVRHDHARIGVGALKDDVAASLSTDDESNSQKHLNQFLSRQVGRKLHYRDPVVSSTNSRPTSVGTGSPEAMQSSI